MSALNSSLGLIYTYLKNNVMAGAFESAIWSECVDSAVWIAKKVMFLTISPEFASTIMFGILINTGYRDNFIWHKYFSKVSQLNLYTPTLSILE